MGMSLQTDFATPAGFATPANGRGLFMFASLQLVSDYKHQDGLRLSFNRLAQATFGIDFEAWYQKGAWDGTYVCYSFAEGERIVANVSVSHMTLLLDGQAVPATQLGTVMTHPDYRGRGLIRKLLDTALASSAGRTGNVFLFANPTVAGLYPKWGFRRSPFYRFRTERDSLPGGGRQALLHRLDVNNPEDWALIVRLARERAPVSRKCDAVGSSSIFLWYCLNVFPGELYYAEELKLLLAYRIHDGTVELMDAVSPRPVLLEDICRCIAGHEQSVGNMLAAMRIEFDFTPDFADLEDLDTICWEEKDELFFVKPDGGLHLPKGYVLPAVSRT